MKEITITAEKRTDKPGKTRRSGYTPGNIYGTGLEASLSLKFDTIVLLRALRKIEKNTRVRLTLDGSEYSCIIKEIQRHPETGELLHLDLQAVADEKLVRLRLPLVFKGRNLLEKKLYVLHVYTRELLVAGRVDAIPEYLVADLADKKPGDKIMVKDISTADGLKLLDDKNEIVAAVGISRELEAVS